MYIWMVLATFIVMLATFNLSPRNDLRNKQQVPMAEAAITKFLIHHNAAVKYAKTRIELNRSNPDIETGIETGKLNDCDSSDEGGWCSYFPIGFNYEDEPYFSGTYCLNPAEYTSSTNPDTGEITQTITKQEGTSEVTDCSETNKVIYVISYGQVPQRWKNVSTNRILGEYYTAMHSKVAVGSSCGIVVPKTIENDENNPLDSGFVIDGIDVKNKSIPAYLLNDYTFQSKCPTSDEYVEPCIIYVTRL